MTDEHTNDGTTTPPQTAPPRQRPDVDVVQGNKVRTYHGAEVVGERDLDTAAPTPARTPEPAPAPTPAPESQPEVTP